MIVNCVPQGLVMDTNGRVLTPQEAQQWAYEWIYGRLCGGVEGHVQLPKGLEVVKVPSRGSVSGMDPSSGATYSVAAGIKPCPHTF